MVAGRTAAGAVLAASVATMSGCDAGAPTQPAPPASASPSGMGRYGPHVVNYDGVHGLRFGDTERELLRRGLVVRGEPRCGPRMAQPTGANPVFIDGRLALVWADPPLHTPEGIAVGTSVASARAAYPSASDLTAPAGSYRFNGLLASDDDRAYLFLHDGHKVQKLIVGYAAHARTLFRRGFTGC